MAANTTAAMPPRLAAHIAAKSTVAMPPRLLRAYRASAYTAGDMTVRIGRHCPAMDAWLGGTGCRTGCFITAWNPRSRRMPEGWNDRAQRQLTERARRFTTMPAGGSLRHWHEAHLLVAADPRPILRLARLFRQRGVVLVSRRRAARLVVLLWNDIG